MKISVLIPAYRAATTIRRALASVQTQTHFDWEVFVVEDGSHDGTEEIVRQFAREERHSVRYENLGRNQGVAATRSRLLWLATGAVAFLDSDDWWSPDHLAAGVRQLEAGADLVATGVRTFDLTNQQTLQQVRPPESLETDPVATLFKESVIITSSCVLLSSRLVLATGNFDPTFAVGEDRDYWLRAAVAGARFAIAPGLTCNYAKHARSTMSGTLLVAAQTVRFYEKHFNLAAIPARKRRHQLAHSLINEGRLLRATDARSSARLLSRAWRLAPYNPMAAAQWLFSSSHAAFRA